MVVYLPIFALTGVEGKMFHPMAFTVVMALLGAMILSVTFIPAAVALFIGEKVAEKENVLMRGQARLCAGAGSRHGQQAGGAHLAAVVIVLSGLLATRMGSEFAPSNEGDFAIQALRIPGTSLTQSVEMQQQLEKRLKAKFPRSSACSRAPARRRSPPIRCRPTSRMATSCSSPSPSGPSRAGAATRC
jgi:cobalt-zinc-cadmium resistance protein CzcA